MGKGFLGVNIWFDDRSKICAIQMPRTARALRIVNGFGYHLNRFDLVVCEVIPRIVYHFVPHVNHIFESMRLRILEGTPYYLNIVTYTLQILFDCADMEIFPRWPTKPYTNRWELNDDDDVPVLYLP